MDAHLAAHFLEFLLRFDGGTDAGMYRSSAVLLHVAHVVVEQLLFQGVASGIVHILHHDPGRQIRSGLDQVFIEAALKMHLSVNVDPVSRTDLFQILQLLFLKIPQVAGHNVQCLCIIVRVLVCAHDTDDFLLDLQTSAQRLGDILMLQEITDHVMGSCIIPICF